LIFTEFPKFPKRFKTFSVEVIAGTTDIQIVPLGDQLAEDLFFGFFPFN